MSIVSARAATRAGLAALAACSAVALVGFVPGVAPAAKEPTPWHLFPRATMDVGRPLLALGSEKGRVWVVTVSKDVPILHSARVSGGSLTSFTETRVPDDASILFPLVDGELVLNGMKNAEGLFTARLLGNGRLGAPSPVPDDLLARGQEVMPKLASVVIRDGVRVGDRTVWALGGAPDCHSIGGCPVLLPGVLQRERSGRRSHTLHRSQGLDALPPHRPGRTWANLVRMARQQGLLACGSRRSPHHRARPVHARTAVEGCRRSRPRRRSGRARLRRLVPHRRSEHRRRHRLLGRRANTHRLASPATGSEASGVTHPRGSLPRPTSRATSSSRTTAAGERRSMPMRRFETRYASHVATPAARGRGPWGRSPWRTTGRRRTSARYPWAP